MILWLPSRSGSLLHLHLAIEHVGLSWQPCPLFHVQILARAKSHVALSASALAMCCSLAVLNQSQVVVVLGLDSCRFVSGGECDLVQSVVNLWLTSQSGSLLHLPSCYAMSITHAASVSCANTCTCQAHVALVLMFECQCAQHLSQVVVLGLRIVKAAVLAVLASCGGRYLVQ
jgi:hypothetical protein